MRRGLIVAALLMVWSAASAFAGDLLFVAADGVNHYGLQPWEAGVFRRDVFASRLCYNYSCYLHGTVGGKVYHTYYPGIYRYNYQHLYHRKMPRRCGRFSMYRDYGRHPRPYGYDFTTNRFSSRHRGYDPNRGSDVRRHSGSPVRSGADTIRERARFGRR